MWRQEVASRFRHSQDNQPHLTSSRHLSSFFRSKQNVQQAEDSLTWVVRIAERLVYRNLAQMRLALAAREALSPLTIYFPC